MNLKQRRASSNGTCVVCMTVPAAACTSSSCGSSGWFRLLAQPRAHHGGLKALLLEQEGVLGTSGGLTRTCGTAVQHRAEASATSAATSRRARAKRGRPRAQHEQASLHSCAPAMPPPRLSSSRQLTPQAHKRSPCRPTIRAHPAGPHALTLQAHTQAHNTRSPCRPATPARPAGPQHRSPCRPTTSLTLQAHNIAHPTGPQHRSPCRPTNMTTLVLPFFSSVFLGSPPSSMAHSSSNTACTGQGFTAHHQAGTAIARCSPSPARSLAAVQL